MANSFADFLHNQEDKIENHYKNGLEKYIKTHDRGVRVTDRKDALNIAYTIMQDPENDMGSHVIDLKQYFALSEKRKHRKDGTGWYLKVPIRIKSDEGRRAYGSKAWKEISNLPFGVNYNPGVDPAKIQKVLGASQDGVMNKLKYTWKSANVTRRQWGNSGKRGRYYAIRTVSDKSPANSWIVNRQGFSKNEDNQELAPYITQILKAQMEKYNQIGSNF